MDITTTLFSVIILIVSIIFHELAHGATADYLGDPTPGMSGRLTLNPISHMELVGSFLLPLLCIISGSGFIIGWAKPVPFNPTYFKDKRWGPALVAVAGPAMNMIIAGIAAIAFRIIFMNFGMSMVSLMTILSAVVVINSSLAVFNMVPVPPLDGHHILGALFPKYKNWAVRVMNSYGLVLLIIVIFFAGSIIGPIVSWLVRIMMGA